MPLRWKEGVFVVERGPLGLDRLTSEQRAEDVFLTLLSRFVRENRNVSPNPGKTYAPTLFAAEPEGAGMRPEFRKAMSRLFAANKIHVRKSGPPSRERSLLMAGAKP
jgi:hypothetical protein